MFKLDNLTGILYLALSTALIVLLALAIIIFMRKKRQRTSATVCFRVLTSLLLIVLFVLIFLCIISNAELFGLRAVNIGGTFTLFAAGGLAFELPAVGYLIDILNLEHNFVGVILLGGVTVFALFALLLAGTRRYKKKKHTFTEMRDSLEGDCITSEPNVIQSFVYGLPGQDDMASYDTLELTVSPADASSEPFVYVVNYGEPTAAEKNNAPAKKDSAAKKDTAPAKKNTASKKPEKSDAAIKEISKKLEQEITEEIDEEIEELTNAAGEEIINKDTDMSKPNDEWTLDDYKKMFGDDLDESGEEEMTDDYSDDDDVTFVEFKPASPISNEEKFAIEDDLAELTGLSPVDTNSDDTSPVARTGNIYDAFTNGNDSQAGDDDDGFEFAFKPYYPPTPEKEAKPVEEPAKPSKPKRKPASGATKPRASTAKKLAKVPPKKSTKPTAKKAQAKPKPVQRPTVIAKPVVTVTARSDASKLFKEYLGSVDSQKRERLESTIASVRTDAKPQKPAQKNKTKSKK